MPFTLISTETELEDACRSARVLLFVDVEWSMPARHSLRAVELLVGDWERAHPTLSIQVFRVDLTEQTGELWEAMRAWLRNQGPSVDDLTFGGGGSLLWVRSGRIVSSVVSAGSVGREELLRVTSAAFEVGQNNV